MAATRSGRKDFFQSTAYRRCNNGKKATLALAQLGRQCAELLLFRHVPLATAVTNRGQRDFIRRSNASFNPSRRPWSAGRPHKHYSSSRYDPLRNNPASQRHKHRHADGRQPPPTRQRDHTSRRRRLRKRPRRPLAPQSDHSQMADYLSTKTAFAARALARHSTKHRLLLFQLG
jgi:hypothetical protein